MFPVYETKKCDKTSEKTVLEAGNNTMDLNCTDAFKGNTGGTVCKIESLHLQILGSVASFLGDWAKGWGLAKFSIPIHQTVDPL